MKTQQIQAMRSLLAAQAAFPETGAPRFRRTLKSVFAQRKPSTLAFPEAVHHASTLEEAKETEPLLLQADFAPLDEPAPRESVSLEILLGHLAPSRSAFGQRTEPVLELKEPAPAQPHRLTLMDPSGAAVGEIILHAAELASAKNAKPRRPFEPLHSQAPFFPEDLTDEPPSRLARPAMKASAPTLQLAATFLLATLAARLASEEALLCERLEVARSLAKVA